MGIQRTMDYHDLSSISLHRPGPIKVTIRDYLLQYHYQIRIKFKDFNLDLVVAGLNPELPSKPYNVIIT